MVKKLLEKLGAALMVAALFGTMPAVAQEPAAKVYIKSPVTVEPGVTTSQKLVISMDATNAEETFCAFQMDIVLSDGLEFEYRNGKPRITMVKPGVYPSYTEWDDDDNEVSVYTHSLNMSEINGGIRVIVYSSDPDEDLRYFAKKKGDLLNVYVKTTPYLKPGDVNITLRGVTFANLDATAGFKADELILTGLTAEATSTLPVKVSSTNKFSTAVFPFDVDAIPAGLEVYSCNSTNGENLVLTKQSKAVAYTPYILYAENGFDGTLSGAVDASKYSEVVSDGYLRGAVAAQEIDGGNGCYVMQNKGDGVMFYSVDDDSFSIPAGKCWLALPAALQGSASFRLDGTTGIGEVKGENGEVKTIYDLTGRKVNAENGKLKGLYIINGKKVLVK